MFLVYLCQILDWLIAYKETLWLSIEIMIVGDGGLGPSVGELNEVMAAKIQGKIIQKTWIQK